MEVGSSFWRRVVLFLFVCLLLLLLFFFQLLRWVIILFFKSHKWVRFSCFFSFKMFNFPTIIYGQVDFFLVPSVGKVFCFLLFLFVCLSLFYSVLFCFVFLFLLPKIPSPLDIKCCALILILLHR